MEQQPVTLPLGHDGPFDPPPELAELRSKAPLTPLTYHGGHVGWLVTGYEVARAVLADPRFSSRGELKRTPANVGDRELAGVPAEPGAFIALDPPEHTRYRQLLTPQFTVRRMRQLRARVTEVVSERLDAMEQSGPPADLVAAFALAVPSMLICELLGIPYEDREEFQDNMYVLRDIDASPERKSTAFTSITSFFAPLIEAKRSTPGDDFYSGLINSGELTDQELTNIGLILFSGGFETTTNMLALGTFALLQHPDQITAMRADPGNAVEELMRYLSIVHIGPTRTALEDVELADQLIKQGEVVTISIPAANRDPAHFTEPDVLDVTRAGQGHLGFGHGAHFCLGQQLARMEMRIAFPALFDRFPNLRLACPPDDVPRRERTPLYGVENLPVTW